MEKANFYDFTQSELEDFLIGLGEKKFRAQQLFRWVYGLGVTELEEMTNLSKAFREKIPDILEFKLPKMVDHKISVDGTQKFLFGVEGGENVESVLIPSDGRMTLCVSSEVGCNMACKFCFTGKQKLKKRLSVSEINGQLYQAQKVLTEEQRVTNIVFMGMGEPLDNCDNVFRAIEVMRSPMGFNLSRKRITVSTSGLIPQIPLVAEAGVRLAVSLNGVDDEVRNSIMPINRKWPIADLLEACREHYRQTKDLVTIEYVLLKGITDSLADAQKLHRLLREVPCKINIIPFNEHPGSGFHRPSNKQIDAFQAEMMRLGSHVLRRKTMGRDIYAACGQLRTAYEQHPKEMSL